MVRNIDVVFERGVFRPTQPISVEEGTRARVVLDTNMVPATASPEQRLAVARQIAMRPLESATPADQDDLDDLIYRIDEGA